MPLDVHSLLSYNRPPPLFYPALYLFNLFPLHAPLTLFGIDAPYGRFSHGKKGWMYINGNVAWALSELTSPITLLGTIWSSRRPLSPIGKLLIALYSIHYLHRSVLSPLVYSPKRTPQHIIIPFFMGLFNLFNGFLMGCGIVFFPATQTFTDIRTVVGLIGWVLGFAGNVYHDEVLNDLRRPPNKRLVSSLTPAEEKGDKDAASEGHGHGRYLIPRAGLFRFISFPNYFCEIIEWTAFAIIAVPPISPSLGALPYTLLTPLPALNIVVQQAHDYPFLQKLLGYIPQAAWPSSLIAPAYLFALNAAANLTPRAIRGHAWYRETFGSRFPEERKAIVPFLL